MVGSERVSGGRRLHWRLIGGGFAVYREGVQGGQNPVLKETGFCRDGTISHIENFFECIKSPKEPNAPVEAGVAAARAGHIGNLAYQRGGGIWWRGRPLDGGQQKHERRRTRSTTKEPQVIGPVSFVNLRGAFG